MSLSVRVRGPNGTSTIQLTPETTFKELGEIIATKTGIEPETQELKHGFPPKLIEAEPQTKVGHAGIKHGDSLVLSRGSQKPSAAASISPPVQQSPTPTTAAVPTSSARPSQKKGGINVEGLSVQFDGGFLAVRVVPDDNECLYHALGIVLEQANSNISSAMRQRVAKAIKEDPIKFPDIILGGPRDEYIANVLKQDTWGGAIEISVLSDVYQVEIASIDVQTGRVDRYGQDKNYELRAILIYSGIHYDAITSTPIQPSPDGAQQRDFSFDTTLFPTSDSSVLPACERLIQQLQQKHYYTDTSNFTIKCNDCGAGLKGQKDVVAHASQTGHTSFGEY